MMAERGEMAEATTLDIEVPVRWLGASFFVVLSATVPGWCEKQVVAKGHNWDAGI